jgi:hypothetical protein
MTQPFGFYDDEQHVTTKARKRTKCHNQGEQVTIMQREQTSKCMSAPNATTKARKRTIMQ